MELNRNIAPKVADFSQLGHPLDLHPLPALTARSGIYTDQVRSQWLSGSG